jgi:RNA polymerase sigma-70 factor, ECF subfamily
VANRVEATPRQAEEGAVIAAARAGDQAAFTALVDRHRRELHVHCYRILGSFEDAEDLVQETFLRAWRNRESFQGRSTFRAWLYRIATNACLDALAHRQRHAPPPWSAPTAPAMTSAPVPDPEIAWLQPYPDRLLEPAAPGDAEPDALLVARETIELAFLVAIQHLPPRQRAVLILRDVLGWSARDTASLLEASVGAANSALQRARATMRQQLPPRRLDWAAAPDPSAEERAVLQRYMDAHERADVTALAELLASDARMSMPPYAMWLHGRGTIVALTEPVFDPGSPSYFGDFRLLPTRANRQPAAACYRRRPGDSEFRALSLDVLRVEDGKVAEIIAFLPEVFPAFGLPPTL